LEINRIFPFLLPNDPLSVAYEMLVSSRRSDACVFAWVIFYSADILASLTSADVRHSCQSIGLFERSRLSALGHNHAHNLSMWTEAQSAPVAARPWTPAAAAAKQGVALQFH
jgi:hypothetical protein